MTKLGPKQLKVLDAVAGQAAFEGTAWEHETLRTFTFRLRVQDRRITEIEQIVSRDVPPIFDGKAATWAPDPILTVQEKAGSMTREAMARRADSYYAAVELNDDSAAHFENCSRDEMGKITGTDGTCGNDFKDMRWSYIEKVRPRRMLVIDEEQGVVYGFSCFEQTGHMTSYLNPRTGKTVQLPAHNTYPLNVYAGVAIKVRDDKVLKVQGIWTTLPYGMPIPWDKAGF
jgi:hypothetical protein